MNDAGVLLLLCCIYDSAMEAYMPPFVQRAKGEAIRTFKRLVDDPQTNIFKSPADFTLFVIGTWDERSGVFAPYEAKQNLGTALVWKDAVEPAMKILNTASGGAHA